MRRSCAGIMTFCSQHFCFIDVSPHCLEAYTDDVTLRRILAVRHLIAHKADHVFREDNVQAVGLAYEFSSLRGDSDATTSTGLP